MLSGGRYSYSISLNAIEKTWTANWITGPLAGHPQLLAFATKPIEGSVGAYGLMGLANGYGIGNDGDWFRGMPIGATQQSPTVLVLSRFHSSSTPYTSAIASVSLTKAN